jgi:hypothetical protein
MPTGAIPPSTLWMRISISPRRWSPASSARLSNRTATRNRLARHSAPPRSLTRHGSEALADSIADVTCLQASRLLETEVPSVTDHDVVEDCNSEYFTGRDQAFSDRQVVCPRRRIARRMVMAHDDRSSVR